MKYILTLVLICSFTMISYSQSGKEEFYYFTATNKPTSRIDSTATFTKIYSLGDGRWQWENYNLIGPMISSEQYDDHDGTKPNGQFTFYRPNGYIDSTGSVVNGLLEGEWNFCNDTGRVIFQKKYARGVLIQQRDLLKEEKDAQLVSSSVLEKVEIESEFPGGIAAWTKYLLKNLKYPERAYNGNIMGDVVVQFVVNTEGKTESVQIFRSVEYSLDEEAKRILMNSPLWKPASQDGKLVKSYKRQPIRFRLQ